MSRPTVHTERASGLWRSEDMRLVRLTVQREAGPYTITRLGKLGIFQPIDLNPEVSAFQRSHTEIIRRCEELNRKLRAVSEEFGRARVDPEKFAGQPTQPAAAALAEEFAAMGGSHGVDNIERSVEAFHTRAMETVARYHSLAQQRNNLMQYQSVLRALATEAQPASMGTGRVEHAPLLASGESAPRPPAGGASAEAQGAGSLHVLAGTIPMSQMDTLHRGAWRVTRGNFIIHNRAMEPIESTSGELVNMTVFIAYCASSRSAAMVRRLATALGAVLYDEAVSAGSDSNRMLLDLRDEIVRVDAAVAQVLQEAEALASVYSKQQPLWAARVAEEKGVAAQLNFCNFGSNTMTTVGWVPSKDYQRLVAAMHEASAQMSATMQPMITPEPVAKRTIPTYFRVNSFTSNFQQIVDAYGIARYKEVNPGVFTIVTFPFLFGIMFGDFGHGAIMLLLSLLLVGFQSKLAHITNEMFQMVFGGRYLLLLMSIYAIYVGTLYNDCFSLSVLMPGPKWSWEESAMMVITIPGGPTPTPVPVPHTALRTVTPLPTVVPAPVLVAVTPTPMAVATIPPSVMVAGPSSGGTGHRSAFATATTTADGRKAWATEEGVFTTPPPGSRVHYNCHEFEPIEGVNMTLIGQQCVAQFPGGLMAAPRAFAESPYWGVDGTWAGATNKLDFLNSYKMKQSVILGVIHMLLGVAMGGLNYIHRRDFPRLFFMTIPEMLFLGCTFGWMDVLIIIKWLKRWPATNTAPSLLTEMTSFFLAPGSKPLCYIEPGQTNSTDGCHITPDVTGGSNFLFPGQFTLQPILLLVAVVSIVLILVPVLCIHFLCHKKKADPKPRESHGHVQGEGESDAGAVYTSRDAAVSSAQKSDGSGAAIELFHDHATTSALDHAEEHGEDEHDTTEVVIHQIIHTIEYALGCVSNTASYLRLWALSLAHAQLAEVFWQFTFEMALTMTGSPIIIGFASAFLYMIWIGATFGVLVGMEGLSAFLHALRLHWVEFQNKFYQGDGVLFTPFTLQELSDDGERFAVLRGANAA